MEQFPMQPNISIFNSKNMISILEYANFRWFYASELGFHLPSVADKKKFPIHLKGKCKYSKMFPSYYNFVLVCYMPVIQGLAHISFYVLDNYNEFSYISV